MGSLGLLRIRFARRAEALEALETALIASGLMDATVSTDANPPIE